MRFVLAILATLMIATLAPSASAKGPKASAAKVHLCESIDVYTGAVDASHPSTRIAEACRDVSVKVAQKAVDKCSAESAEVCEVLYSADRKTLMIERKILVSSDGGAK